MIVTKHNRRDSRQSRRGTSSDKCQSLMPGKFKNGAPDWIRTSDPCLRRAILYPAELRAHIKILPISLATCRSALGHSPVTPLSLRIDRFLEVPDSPDVLAQSRTSTRLLRRPILYPAKLRAASYGVAILLAAGKRRPAPLDTSARSGKGSWGCATGIPSWDHILQSGATGTQSLQSNTPVAGS